MHELEELTQTFACHAKKAESERLKMIEHHKTHFSDTPVPEHLTEEFCIAKALHLMCVEIEKLWISIGGR